MNATQIFYEVILNGVAVYVVDETGIVEKMISDGTPTKNALQMGVGLTVSQEVIRITLGADGTLLGASRLMNGQYLALCDEVLSNSLYSAFVLNTHLIPLVTGQINTVTGSYVSPSIVRALAMGTISVAGNLAKSVVRNKATTQPKLLLLTDPFSYASIAWPLLHAGA